MLRRESCLDENPKGDSAHPLEPTLQFFPQSPERKECERTEKDVFLGRICVKCLSRAKSESKGLAGKFQ